MENHEIRNTEPINEEIEKMLSKTSSYESFSSNDSKDETRSTGSKASGDGDKKMLPTFTNEVVVIRPEVFYENEDCQTDNKFMKSSGLKKQSTNDLVSFLFIKTEDLSILIGLN